MLATISESAFASCGHGITLALAALCQFQTRLGLPIQTHFWRIEYHGYSHLYGPMIFLIVALCIDRGVRRFERATILFARPATTIALLLRAPRYRSRRPDAASS